MRKDAKPPSGSTELRRRAEERLSEKAPAKTGPVSDEERQRLHHELQVHQIQLEMQNEELLRAKSEAEEALARFIDLYEFAPVGYLTLDTKGTILAVNLTGATILAEDRSRLVGLPFGFFLADDQSHLLHFLDKVFAGPDHQFCEVTLKPSDETERYVRLEAHASSGRECRVALVDITGVRQEELFHLQLECVEGYAIYLLDKRGTILNWNPGAERLKGYRAEEIIGKNFSCLYSEKDREDGKPEQALRKAAAEGRLAEECWRIRKDGSGFWADVVLTPLLDDKGRLWGFSKVTHDITDRKKAQEELSFSEARYRALFEDNPTIIFTLDAQWNTISANKSTLSQLGYSKEELEGQSVLKLVSPDDREAVAKQFQLCISQNEVCHWQFRTLCKDGRLLWVEETARATLGTDGRPILLVVCQDVTERKRAERELLESEEKFSKVFSLAPIGMTISTLANGRFIEINEAGERLSGYPRDEVIGRSSAEFSIWNDASERTQVIGEVVKNGEVRDREMVMKNKAGQAFWGSFSAVVIEIKGEKHLLSLVSDINERKRAQEALAESEERFRLMADTAPVFVWISGTDTLCTFFNKPWLEFTGRSLEQEQGKGWTEGVHPDDRQGCLDTYLTAFSARRDFNMEYRLRRADGEYRWIVDTGVPRFLPNGDFAGYIGSCFDVTERKQTEEEIRKLNMILAQKAEELETVNEELEAFNYTVAHDLRQPLNIITSCCQIIERLHGDRLDDDCRQHVQMVYKSTLRMDRLIAALLNFSRMGRVEPQKVIIDLSPIALELTGMLQQTEPERQVDFRIPPSVMAHCDGNLLRSVLENLLGNAWKYTAIREKAVIEFGVRDIGGVPTYFVRDNGAGFDAADADKLFTPFQRLPGVENQPGFGIGLATVERIIQRHGGKVWAEGEKEKGACFYFTLATG